MNQMSLWPSPWQPLAKLRRQSKKVLASVPSTVQQNNLPKQMETPSEQRHFRQLLVVNINTKYKHMHIIIYIHIDIGFTCTHLRPGMMQGTRAVGKAPHGPKLQRPLSRIWQNERKERQIHKSVLATTCYDCSFVPSNPSISFGNIKHPINPIGHSQCNAYSKVFPDCTYDKPRLWPRRT